MAKTVRLGGTEFNHNFFVAYMNDIFGESFSFSSLSFEKTFLELKKYNDLLNEFANAENSKYALLLDNGSDEDHQLLFQRFKEVEAVLKHMGVPEERMVSAVEDGEFMPCIDDFSPYIQGAIRPYRNTRELEAAREQGLLVGEKYEEETLIDRARILYGLYASKVMAETDAKNYKKGNNAGFKYALTCDKLGASQIVEINNLINNGQGIHSGFKSTDNSIGGLTAWTPAPKELVPQKIAELLWKYDHEWADAIPKAPVKDDYEDKRQWLDDRNKYQYALCYREALFHIEFERIHPFEDGNGRTGRIILNRNLIKNEMAPILITPEMREVYLDYIDYYKPDQLATFIYGLSSVQLTTISSAYRKAKGIKPDEIDFNLPEGPKLKLDLNKKK